MNGVGGADVLTVWVGQMFERSGRGRYRNSVFNSMGLEISTG